MKSPADVTSMSVTDQGDRSEFRRKHNGSRDGQDSIKWLDDGNFGKIQYNDKDERLISLESDMVKYAIRSHDQKGAFIPNQVKKISSQQNIRKITSGLSVG
jgi:hypothetical protein